MHNLGKVPHGLKLHPDRVHMIYPLGCNLVIENLQTRQQEFLLGHNNNISCLTISNNGKYIASGQVTFMGFKVQEINFLFQKKYITYFLGRYYCLGL